METCDQIVTTRRRGTRRAIIFVHGLNGHPVLSWQRFPEFLAEDDNLSGWDIYSFGYASSFSSITAWAPSYETLALLLYTQLRRIAWTEYEQFAIVAYSEGGLIVQLALLNHDDLVSSTSHVFFFGVPNAGIRLLSLEPLHSLSWLFNTFIFVPLVGPLLSGLVKFVFRPLFDLRPGSPFLLELRRRWQDKFGAGAPFEYWAIAGDRDQLVSLDSLLSFPVERRLVIPGDHYSLIKPESSDAASVQVVRNGLREQQIPENPRRAAEGTIALESKQEADEFDVFLYHASADGSEVREVAGQLELRGIRSWLSEEHVTAGRSWKEPLLSSIDRIGAVAVFMGKAGVAHWQKKEPIGIIKEFADRQRPIIPVQLPGAPDSSELPDNINDREPVDFRDPNSNPLERLIDGIRGNAPARRAVLESLPIVLKTTPTSRRIPSNAPPRKPMKYTAAGVIVLLVTFVGWRVYEHWVDCGKLVDEPIVHRADRDTAHYIPNMHKGNADRVLVFVHGIFGNAEGTWTSPSDTYWPDLVNSDDQFGGPDIYVAAYDTGVVNRMSIDEVAEGLYQRFEDAGIFTRHRQVIFVCHSLGGLIVQRLLLKHREKARQVPLVYFYGTPKTGAQVARVGSVFSDDPLLHEMAPGASNGVLRTMESDWDNAGFSNTRRLCAYEKLRYKCVLVVDDLSGTSGCDKAVALNKNHVTIVKPRNVQDESYILLRNAWRELPPPIVPSTVGYDGAFTWDPVDAIEDIRFRSIQDRNEKTGDMERSLPYAIQLHIVDGGAPRVQVFVQSSRHIKGFSAYSVTPGEVVESDEEAGNCVSLEFPTNAIASYVFVRLDNLAGKPPGKVRQELLVTMHVLGEKCPT